MMADGGNTVRGIDVLRHQPDLLGEVASPATLSRAFGEVDQAALDRIDAARAAVRARVWDLIVARHGRIPPARVPNGDLGDQIVLRIDAHFIDAYSRKEQAGRLRGRYGLHPLAVICDNTGECLAERLRPDTADANDADDHIELLTRAIAQIPPPRRRNLLITADGAGATHELLAWITSLNREPDARGPRYAGGVLRGLAGGQTHRPGHRRPTRARVDPDARRRRRTRHPRHPGHRIRPRHRRRGRRHHHPATPPVEEPDGNHPATLIPRMPSEQGRMLALWITRHAVDEYPLRQGYRVASSPVSSRPTVEELLAAAVGAVPDGTGRPGQQAMSAAVAHAAETGEHLLVQAGTGTGKSLAYLVPALLVDGPVVVSTATLALQSQLVDHDLPRLADAAEPLLRRRPTFAVLKGRHHHACLARLEGTTEEEPEDALFETSTAGKTRWLGEAGQLGKQIQRLREWALESETGDRDELDPGVDDSAWRLVSMPARECVGAAHELADRVSSAAQADLTPDLIDRAARRARAFIPPEHYEALTEAGDGLALGLTEAPPGRIVNGLPAPLREALTLLNPACRRALDAIG